MSKDEKKIVEEIIKPLFDHDQEIDNVLETYRLALQFSPIPVVIHTEDGEFLLMSESVCNQTGYEYEEISNRDKWTKKLHRDRKEYNEQFIANNFSHGITLQGEEENVYTKSGQVLIWAFYNAVIGKLHDGRKVIITYCVDVTQERVSEHKLNQRIKDVSRFEALIRASIESQKGFVILMVDLDFNYLYFNELHKNNMKLLYGVDITMDSNLLDSITIKDDRDRELARYKKALQGESYSLVDAYGDQQDQYYETFYNPIRTVDGDIIGLSIFTSNITKQIQEIKRIKESEEKFRLIYASMSQGLAVHQVLFDDQHKPVDYLCLEVNESYLELFNYKREDIVGKKMSSVVPDLDKRFFDLFFEVALTGEPKYFERYSNVAKMHLSVYVYCPKIGQFAVLLSDISDRIKREKEIKYLSFNDQLTGVYNRRYYEEQIRLLDNDEFLPLSMILGDVNGLKLVNDSFGHQMGDKLLVKVANILEKSCRNSDVITRIGGDEFVVILPNTDSHQAKQVIDRIQKLSSKEKIESIEVSISFGYGTKYKMEESVDLLFKQIEDDMYRNKLNESASMRSKTIDLIMTTLYEKNEREMFHSKRVGGYCQQFAKALDLDQTQTNKLVNAGLMHDIGKIGIDDHILNKNTHLSKKEIDEVRKHSEIGYRILSSLNEFSDTARIVLEHHERYDGQGYPYGLMGDEISLFGRIINIVDSYDAMTGPRPYQQPISKNKAIQELIKCKGSQFDPELVDRFIKEVL